MAHISLWLKTLSGDYSDYSAIFFDIKACFALILIHSIIIQPFQLSWGEEKNNNNHLLFMQMTGPLKRSLLADGWYLKWTMWSFGYFCHEILFDLMKWGIKLILKKTQYNYLIRTAISDESKHIARECAFGCNVCVRGLCVLCESAAVLQDFCNTWPTCTSLITISLLPVCG